MSFPSKKLEQQLLSRGYDTIIAIDEVGMGCLAGPVVVCAVLFPAQVFQQDLSQFDGVRDSKLLTASAREHLTTLIRSHPDLKISLRYCQPQTIDRLNIYQAARSAMRRAVQGLVSRIQNIEFRDHTKYQIPDTKFMILIDGNKTISDLSLPQKAIVHGDRNVFSIACASVVAKVYRDAMMARYAKRYPNYGFEQHKGYGTKFHYEQLKKLGITPLHRRSFALT